MSSPSRSVIFLDIDGVIVPVSPMSFGGGDIDDTCLQRLKLIVAAAGGIEHVTIVLSSTWRHDEKKKERLNKAFDAIGGIPKTTLGVPDGTSHPPTTVTYLKKDPQEQKLVRDRVDEIYEWMLVNAAQFPEAHVGGRWFAIDDMNLGVDARMKGHFLKTDTEEGIMSGDVVTAKTLIEALPAYIAEATTTATSTTAVVEPVVEIAKKDETTTAPAAVAATPNPPPPTTTSFVPLAIAKGTTTTTESTTTPPPPPRFDTQQPPEPITSMRNGEPLLPGVTYYGVVKRYNPNRGFGFVTAPNGEDVFVHQSMINHQGFRAVNVGEAITFQIVDDSNPAATSTTEGRPHPNRRQAVHIRQLSPYIPTNIQRQMMAQWDMYQPIVGGVYDGAAVVGNPSTTSATHGGRGGRGGRGRGAAAAHTDPNTSVDVDGATTAPAGQDGSATTRGRGNGQARGEYHGPGTRGRGGAYHDLPLIPDGLGFRAVNGTVFFYAAQPATGASSTPLPPPPPSNNNQPRNKK